MVSLALDQNLRRLGPDRKRRIKTASTTDTRGLGSIIEAVRL